MSEFYDIQVGDAVIVKTRDGSLKRLAVMRVTKTRFGTTDGTSFLKAHGRATGAGIWERHYASRITPELEAELRQQERVARRWQLIPEIYDRLADLPLEALEATLAYIEQRLVADAVAWQSCPARA